MSKKRIIAMFVSLSIIILLCVLGGAVFVVQDIQIVRMDKNLEANTQITDENIIQKTNISYGKSIFAISESKVVSNIESAFPTIAVVGVERVFPSKIVIKVTERVPVVAIKFKDKDEYLVLDNNMCAIAKVNSNNEKLNNLIMVSGFELLGVNDIYLGKQLPASYGIQVAVVQHIIAGLQQKLPVIEITKKIGEIYFTDIENDDEVIIRTKYGVDRGVNIRIKFTDIKQNKQTVFKQIQKAWDCYVTLEPEQKASGMLEYDKINDIFYYASKNN